VAEKTILLIEDNAGDRAIYGNILWYNGFDVVFAEDGETGIRLAHELYPDLILLDLQLPMMHGSELSSRLKQDDDTKDIPIVALTGRRLSEFGGNAQVLGFTRFLEKPISPLEVLRVIEGIVGRAAIDQRESPGRPELMRYVSVDEVRRPSPERTNATPAVQEIAERINKNGAGILEIWEKLVTEEPWFSLPREDRSGFLGEVVASLPDTALLSANADSCRKTVIAAAAHGRGRRAQQIPESLIPIEFHLLRQALWRDLTEHITPSEDLHQAIRSLDAAITLALNACMWGFFRDEIEAQGMWETAVDRLVGDACKVTDNINITDKAPDQVSGQAEPAVG
jgi:two-component system cell cycle response regulator DivK